MPVLILAILICLTLIIYFHTEKKNLDRNRSLFKIRVHINGIRGKSTVTRMTAGILRAGGYKTLAKTTGSASRIIDESGEDIEIDRKGKPADISEQIPIINQYGPQGFDALVMECMAINPLYQDFLESKVMHSQIGIITNIREDHMEEMGGTLESIARSLSNTIPHNGVLILGEQNPAMIKIVQEEAAKRGSRVVVVNPDEISDKLNDSFHYYQHKANVAVGLALAEELGISRQDAIKGMLEANPDVGNFKIETKNYDFANFNWINLFAINDRESFVDTVQDLFEKPEVKPFPKVVILNNRQDRPYRVKQFLDICTQDLKFDWIVTFGDYETEIQKQMPESQKYLLMGNSSQYASFNGEELLQALAQQLNTEFFVLFGAVNIHTNQADQLLGFIQPLIETKYAE